MKAGRAFAVVGVALLAIGAVLAALLPRSEPLADDVTGTRADGGKRSASRGGEGADASGTDERLQRTSAAGDAPLGGALAAANTVEFDVCVEWPDGRAAADAELWFLPPRSEQQVDADAEEFERATDDEVVLRARGRKAPLDANGRARLPLDVAGALCARSGQHFVSARVSDLRTDQPVRLVLQRDVQLQVEVVDQHGAPRAGVSLALVVRYVRRAAGHADADQVEIPPTDANGIARFAHLQQQTPMPDVDVIEWSGALVGQHRVASMPDVPVSAVELLRGAPIRCVVAAGGIVELALVDGDDRPLRETVRLVDLATGGWVQLHERGEPLQRFHDVPLGRRWRLEVMRGGDVWHQQDLVGPSRADEVVHVPIVVPFRRVQLEFAVVCEDGEPARGATATVLGEIAGGTRAGKAWGSQPATVTDRDKVACKLWLGRGERLARAFVRLQHPSLDAVTDVALPNDVESNADLGRFVVPLPRAREELLRVRVRLAGVVVTPTATIQLDARQHGNWAQGVHESTLDGDYRVLRGLRPPDGFRLVCGHAGASTVTRLAQVGDVLDIELEPAADLVVPVRRRHVPQPMIEAQLLFGERVESGHHDDGSLVWYQVPFGSCTLSLRVDGRELLRRDLPPLVQGRNVWPSFDDPIDLDRLARVVRVRALDEAGAEPAYWARFVVPRGTNTLPERWQECSSPGWLLVDDAPRDLVVWGQQRVPVRLPQPSQDLDVVLHPTTKLVVREAGGAEVDFTIAVTKPGVADPLLHAVLESLADRSERYRLAVDNSEEFDFAPGTELMLRVRRGDAALREQKVVVGASSPQEVPLP